MAAAKDLEVQKKRPVQSSDESTTPVNMFVPTTDIFETEDALTVLVEMPGVEKANVEIAVKDGILTIDGKIDFQKYAGMQPLYTEYSIGNFHRRFSLSNKVDASNIRAEMRDGLLTLTIPKAEEAKAQRIEIA
jgi:HSP20 family molecular chaperone IbpA